MTAGKQAIAAAVSECHTKIATLEQANAQYLARIAEVCASVKRDLVYQQKRPISYEKRPTNVLALLRSAKRGLFI